MSEFKQVSNILKRKFKKHTIHSGDQYTSLDVEIINDSFKIDITSSQTLKASLSLGREQLEALIEDLTEVSRL